MSVLKHRPQPAIVRLPDRIDQANAESVHEQLWAACAPRATVVADLTSTRFCDSTGIRNITGAHERAKALEGQLRLVVPAGVVDLLGLDEVLLIFPTVAAAIHGYADGAPR